MLHSNDILKICEYGIIVNKVDDNEYEVKVLIDQTSYNIYVDSEKHQIYSHFSNRSFKMSENTYIIYLDILLQEIIDYYHYPKKRLIFEENGKKGNGFIKDFKKNKKSELLYDIYEEVVRIGLLPKHIILLKENQVWNEFKKIIEYIYGFQINS